MAVGITIGIQGAEQLARKMQAMKGRLDRETEQAFSAQAMRTLADLRASYSGKVFATHTGLHRKAVNVQIQRAGMNTLAAVGTPMKDAAAHEVGATIRPTGKQRSVIVGRDAKGHLIRFTLGGRMLAIPSKRIMTKQAGTARDVHFDVAAAETFKGAYYTKVSKSGRAVLLMQKGKPVRVIAFLVRSVTLRKGKGMWARQARTTRDRMMQDTNRAVKAAAAGVGLQMR